MGIFIRKMLGHPTNLVKKPPRAGPDDSADATTNELIPIARPFIDGSTYVITKANPFAIRPAAPIA